MFDSANFLAVFETHTGRFKRSFPMKAHVKHPYGTVYFGNSNVGTDSTLECTKNNASNSGLFEKMYTSSSLHHFWLLRVNGQTAKLDAFSKDPRYFLEKDFTLELDKYRRGNNSLDQIEGNLI